METFGLFDVVKIMDIKRMKLQDWIGRGLIVPATPAQGYGTKNVFTIENLCQIELFRSLLMKGFARKTASYLCRNIKMHGKYFIVGMSDKINTENVSSDSAMEIGERVNESVMDYGSEMVLVIDLHSVKKKVERNIKAFKNKK